MYRVNAWEQYDESGRTQLERFASDYKAWLNSAKTEREAAAASEKLCRERGFADLDELIRSGTVLKPGDRVFCKWMDKCVMAFVIGSEPLARGMRILGAHIDSPRVDVKQNPLYEDEGIGYLDTHYYGGIKKYLWAATPLALHGVVIRKDGSRLDLAVGEKDDDPVFCFSDLLIHLSGELMAKPARDVVPGESLNLIVGSVPLKGEEKDAVKAGLLQLLKERYALEEEDFLSAELEIVPAGRARDLGLDRGMILGYGHDDRVCAYPSLRAVADYEGTPERTLCAVLTDKEEIGSVGATGMDSNYFENTVAELLNACGEPGSLALRRCLRNSAMLSSDVSAGFDPNFASSFEKKNTAILGRGVCFNKFTGRGGKSGSSDANPEFIARLRGIMDEAGVAWQSGEIGRVDAGGGGTIAYMCAKYGMDVIDCGVPVLSMHSLYEVASKADLWEAYRGYRAFLEKA